MLYLQGFQEVFVTLILAGGFDAVFCVVMGEDSRNQLVSQFELMDHVTPLLASESSEGYIIH